MKKNLKLNAKISLILLPSFILGIIIFSITINITFKDLIGRLVESRIENTRQEIEGTLNSSGGLSDLLADTIESTGGALSEDQYQEILESYVLMSDTISGSGIWMEPYK